MTDKIRESAVFYLKMDFGLIAAVGALFTLLKLESVQTAQTLYDLSTSLGALSLIIVFGLLIERLTVLLEDVDQPKGKAFRWLLKFLLIIQTGAHVYLFSLFTGYAQGYIAGYVETNKQLETYEVAKDLVNQFFDKKYRIPKTYEELQKEIKFISDSTAKMNMYNFQYRYISENSYSIILPGRDNTISTADDWEKQVVVISKDK